MMRLFTCGALVSLVSLGASTLGCAANVAVPRETRLAPSAPPAPASPTLRATVLAGRHAVRRSFVGPGDHVYAATMDELFVFPKASSASGERFGFRGELAATPSGSRLYRTEGKELIELDASGSDQRKVTFPVAIEKLTFSPSGALLGVMTHEPGAMATLVVVRASDLHEVGRLPGISWAIDVMWSPDDVHAVVGSRLVDTRTMKTVYEHTTLHWPQALFEGKRLFWLFEGLLEIIDVDNGTSTQVWLPCNGRSVADPEQHRFVTACPTETILTNVTSGTPAFTRQSPDSPAAADPSQRMGAPSARTPRDPRFSREAVLLGLIEGANMTLEDGELVVPTKGEPTKVAARVRLAPPRSGGASRKVEVRGDHILVSGADGAALADIDFQAYTPERTGVTLVGDKVVVAARGWEPSMPPERAYVCSFAGTCEAKYAKDTFLGVFGDELVASHADAGDLMLVRENLRTGARTEVALPAAATALVRSEDGSSYVAMAVHKGTHRVTFTRIDTQSGKVTAVLEVDEPSYSSARLLGVVGERIVLLPDFGNYARVVLLDARSFAEKEQYLFGPGSMLHVRDDGTFETTGDAAKLENLLVCTDGKRFGAVAACAHPGRRGASAP